MNDAQTIERPETGTDVAILGPVTALAVFGTDGGVDAILDRITAQARAVETDISTPAGRAAVASLAYKIARSKTALDGMGKDLVADWKTRSAAVDAERRRIRAALDALADEVRAPLTAWEDAEKARVAAHETAIDALIEGPQFYFADNSSEDLAKRLRYLESLPPRDWQEFAKRAADTLASEIAKTKVALMDAVQSEAEAERIAREAREQAEKDRRQREAMIAANARREAEEKARRDAEALATRVELDRRAAALERQRVEREREEAGVRAEQAEADRRASEKQAATERRLAAERSEREARDAAERATAAERQRIADERAAQNAATARREADKKHRAQINNEALADIMRLVPDIAEDVARDVVVEIARGNVRHCKMEY